MLVLTWDGWDPECSCARRWRLWTWTSARPWCGAWSSTVQYSTVQYSTGQYRPGAQPRQEVVHQPVPGHQVLQEELGLEELHHHFITIIITITITIIIITAPGWAGPSSCAPWGPRTGTSCPPRWSTECWSRGHRTGCSSCRGSSVIRSFPTFPLY